MACGKWVYWGITLWTAIFAITVGILFQGSFCSTSSESLSCRLYQYIGFYDLAWGWRKLLLFVRRPTLAVEQKGEKIFPHWLLWMAPFLSGGGYCSEALSYIVGLASSGLVPHLIIEQHGDLANHIFWKGLPSNIKKILIESYKPGYPLNETVVICHSEPGAWYPPLFETIPCPPTGYKEPFYVIGRTMFETDRVSAEHVKRCNRMDEVWIPSEFNRETFTRSGVDPSKLVKIVQSVDVSVFDPGKVKPLGLPSEGRIFGPKLPDHLKFLPGDCYIFLSIFKWERRKGWDLLIQAYMKEFTARDNVVLFLLTNAYHTDRVYDNEIVKYVKHLGMHEPAQGWPALHVTDHHIPQLDLPRLYKSADVFVLPSRGEGWGRPHVEAMSMALPVIATNWSGMTEYMTEANSYPLPLDGFVEVQEGPFKGHLWAEPSIEKLQSLMRHVFSHPSEARAKGLLARQTMVARYSPEVVTKEIVQQLSTIEKKWKEKTRHV